MIIKRKFKCTGCGISRPCIIEINQDNTIFDKHSLICILDSTNKTGYSWKEIKK